MDCRLNVYELPTQVNPAELAGGTVVVIDVLRATTTIIHALEAGAYEVVPCLEVEDAKALAACLREGEYLLGGERGGLPIPGFHLGNRPEEYSPETVREKRIVFTTTNGTRAMMQCRQAARVYLGAFVNASAVVDRLASQEQVHLLCAGSAGEVTRDDVLLAGLLVTRLQQHGDSAWRLNAQAVKTGEDWASTFGEPTGAGPIDPESLAAELRKGPAGRKLAARGLQADILAAAHIDRFQSVPEMDPRSLRIRKG